MTELVLASDDVGTLRSHLFKDGHECCAILFANQTVRTDGVVRLLVKTIDLPSPTDYSRRGPLEAELTPPAVAKSVARARDAKMSVIFVHSHPGAHAPQFSDVDAFGETQLAGLLAHRIPDVTHAAMVMSSGGACARVLGTKDSIRVISLGANREVIFEPKHESDSSDLFDRQVRAFGATAQRLLQGLRIAIVGLGGIGSLVAQELVHLGVRDFILIDPDIIETSNLNRVANALTSDVGRAKVDVAARYIKTFSHTNNVNALSGDVINEGTARELLNADFIFGCTDSHGSRAILQQVAYQYLIPCIDTGVTITVKDTRITHVYGRVQLLAPGLACLTCDELLNSEEVRRDMLTEFERQADPYIQGAHEPAPAVMSLNGTVASLAVTMMLSITAGVPMKARHVLYNAIPPTLRSARATPNPGCFICSRSGALAQADTWRLFTRNS